jgi:hypothetical protein
MLYLRDKFKIFFTKKPIYWLTVLTLSVNFYLWYLIYNFVDFAKEFHVLHYNIYFGIDLIDSPQRLLAIPFLGILILFFNLSLSYIFYIIKKEFIIPYFLLTVSLFINLELIFYLIGVIGMEY